MRTRLAKFPALFLIATLIMIAYGCNDAFPDRGEESRPIIKTVSVEGADWNSSCIAFVSDRDGDEDIYVMDVDGSNVIQLTNNVAADSYPAWSPDGRRIAFVSDRDGNKNIYVMDADGTNVTQFTNDLAIDTTPAWSPDGHYIAFASSRDGDVMGQGTTHPMDYNIYLMRTDGANIVQLTEGGGWIPDWSPDGSRIAFASDRNTDGYMNPDIYLVDVDGSNIMQLTEDPVPDAEPNWSPDGHRIAFVSGVQQDIYLMNIDGSNVIRLTEHAGSDLGPAWSPDGHYIVFMSAREHDANIFLLDTDCVDQPEECDENLIQLTDDPASDSQPAWRPQCTGGTGGD